MFITGILFVLVVLGFALAMYYRNKYLKQGDALTKEIIDLREFHYSINKDVNIEQVGRYIMVVEHDKGNPDLSYVIKSFGYNQNDKNDYDFAIREAEELIEKLKE